MSRILSLPVVALAVFGPVSIGYGPSAANAQEPSTQGEHSGTESDEHAGPDRDERLVGFGETPDRIYIGGGLGASFRLGDEETGAGVTTGDTDDGNDIGFAWKIFAGYRVNEYVGIEAAYHNFGETEAAPGAAATNPDSDGQAQAVAAAITLGYPVLDDLNLFGKAGLVGWRSQQSTAQGNVSDSGVGFMVGLGAQYDLSDEWSLRLGWEGFNDVSADKISQVSSSLMYRF